MKQETKQPLWKELNKKRTKGEWELNYSPNRKHLFFESEIGGERFTNIIFEEVEETDAEYIALAVNNLAPVANALADLIEHLENYFENFPIGGKESDIYNAAKEALNNIS